MELLALSSISAGWLNIGAIQEKPIMGAEGIFFAALAASYTAAVLDPHWVEMKQSGHFEHVDDGCARLGHLTDEQRAELEMIPAKRREFARRLLTSKRFAAIISRLRYQQERREAAAI